MPLQSSRAKEIDVLVKDHQELKTGDHEPVEVAGELKILEVWRFPIKLLVYNIRNGRFASELLQKERELRRRLDPYVPEDAVVIRQLLLEQNARETEALKKHIQQYGQLDPGVITVDGAVINANRRMAIISKLYEETGESKFEYLKAARLPRGVNEKDLWRIEAGIQFAKDFKLNYGPVNELLKLREGSEQGLTPKQISTALLGRYTDKDVEEKLDILAQIDNYLDFIGKRGQYDQVERDIEKFNSLVRNVLQPLKRRGMSARDRADVNNLAFCLIKGGDGNLTHWDIRKLRDIIGIEEAKTEIFQHFNRKDPSRTKSQTIVDSFKDAVEIVDDKKAEKEPEKLLRRAISAVRSISLKSSKLGSLEVKSLIAELEKQIARLRERPDR
jgi:hypothetical protein